MVEIEDKDDDINDGKLLSIGNNREKFNFNIFRKPLNFISAIYNGEISLKEAEFSQKYIEKKIEELKFNYKPKNEKEKGEIYGVLMQANDLLEYRNKIIDAFKDSTFSSKYLKKSDDAAYNYLLKDVKNFIKEIESMSGKINLSLIEDFFELLPVDYAKMLINTNPDENKKIVAEIKDRISDLKDSIRKMNETETKIKMLMRRQRLLKKFLITIKIFKKIFSLHQKLIKKSEPKPEESITERVKLKNKKIAEIKKEQKNINELLKRYFTNYQNPSDMYKTLRDTKGKKNENKYI